MTTVTDAFVASTPIRYWPLDETSGTNANELIANEDGTCSGLTMGGADAPQVGAMIGTKAPVFTGTEYITLRAAKILGGLAQWSVAAWVKYNVSSADTSARYFYSEANPTTGNDGLGAGAYNGDSTGQRTAYGSDSQAMQQFGGNAVYLNTFWTFVVYTRDGASLRQWHNVGGRNVLTGSSGNTWTNSGISSRIGVSPRPGTVGGNWIGSVAHLALYDRVLSQSDQHDIYVACTPRTRPLVASKIFSSPNSIWNQDLTVPGNPPTIRSDSAPTVTHLQAQADAYGAAANHATGPLWVTTNATTQQRVRIAGGHQNIADSPSEMYTALGLTRPPSGFTPNLADTETHATIYNTDADDFFEFIELRQSLAAPWVSATISGTGTLPAGACAWYLAGAKADGSTGRLGSAQVVVNGSQGALISYTEVEGADHINIYRFTAGMANPPGSLKIAEVPATAGTFVDDGHLSLGAAYPGITAVTTDWSCQAAGYFADASTSVGHFAAPHGNWGATATGLPSVGGAVLVEEALAGVIDHALAMGLPEIYVFSHVYPAQRNDGWFTGGNSIEEGTRFQLDPAFDVTVFAAGSIERMCAVALQKYGGYVRDVTNSVSIYIEDAYATGRDEWTETFNGYFDFELFGASFPWSQMRVIDPAWTLAQTTGELPPPPVIPKWATIAENFSTFDTTSQWQVAAGSAAAMGGQLALDSSGTTFVVPRPGSRFIADILESQVVVDIGSTGAAYAEGEAEIWLVNGVLRFVMGVFDPSPYKLFMSATNSADVTSGVGTQPAWNGIAMRYWRIRESAGTVYFETSPDSATWTGRGSVTRASLGFASADYQTMSLYLVSNAYGTSPPALPDFLIGGINSTTGGPGTVSGLIAWWKAEDLALSDGDPVTSWADASGNSHTLTQSTSGKKPLYQTNEISGLPAVVFDGIDDYLATSAFASPTAGITVMVVCALDAVDSVTRTLFAHAAASSWVAPYARALLRINGVAVPSWEAYVQDARYRVNRADTPTAATASTWQLVEMRYDQTQLRVAQDNVKLGGKYRSGALTSSTQPLFVGADGAGASNFKGRIAEIVVYSRGV